MIPDCQEAIEENFQKALADGNKSLSNVKEEFWIDPSSMKRESRFVGNFVVKNFIPISRTSS